MANTDADLIAQIRAALGQDAPASSGGSGSGSEGPSGGSGSGSHGSGATGGSAEAATPSGSSAGKGPEQLYASFMRTWGPRAEGLERPLRLLTSSREDDFYGAIVVEDDFYLDDFLIDIARLLLDLGKVENKTIEREGISLFAGDVLRSVFRSSKAQRTAVPQGRLLALDMLGQYPPEQLGEQDQRLFMSVLGHIVDGRYVLLVGTENEVSAILRANPVLEPTFGENIIHLKGMDTSGVFKSYLENLDDDLRPRVTSEFEARFRDFVEFNADLLLFKGKELADYLSKEANAIGALTLPKERYTSSSLEDMLDEIVGLDKVKETIRALESFAVFKKRAEGHGGRLPSSNMHMAFLGNPGTGKTMVARLIATMLFKIGITRTNKLVEVTSKDLIGKYVGHTDKQVFDKVTEALGGVLFIDEAYALMSEGETTAGFGKEALAELVKCMEDFKDDLVVILAGYEREMQDLIDTNPGLSSRIGYTFHFDDYSVDELLQIFELNATRSGMIVGEGVEARLRQLFTYFSRFKSFGNGRFVGEVLQKALVNHARNLSDGTPNSTDDYLTIAERDVPSRQEMFDTLDWQSASAEDMLAPLVGMATVKEEVLALEQTVAFREVAYKAGIRLPDINLNMVFRGNPGTGKTTVARIIAAILYNIGAVPSSHFEEIEAKDLLSSSAAGNVSKETSKVIERAMGGVMFIDEAYALMDDSRGREALAVLVKAMEDHKGEFVVMFAGYQREMRAFIDENPGLASRIGYTFDFEDYEADDLLEIFRRKMASAGFKLAEGVDSGARDAFRYFHSVENFGNGRFVDRYIQEVIAVHAGRFSAEHPGLIEPDDLPTIKRLCELSATEVFDCTDDEEEAALRRVSIHETGHAICRLSATGKTDIMLITIEHEGNGALGYVQHEGRGMSLPTAQDLRNEMVCLLGGMAAEEVYLGSFSAGNSSDLEKATSIACSYVARYGMSEAGLIQYVGDGFTRRHDVSDLPESVLGEMRHVLDECFADAKGRIEQERRAIDAIVAALGERGTMTGEELVKLWEENR